MERKDPKEDELSSDLTQVNQIEGRRKEGRSLQYLEEESRRKEESEENCEKLEQSQYLAEKVLPGALHSRHRVVTD